MAGYSRAQHFLGKESEGSDFKIQELIRTLDATLASVNPGGLANGKNAYHIMKFLRDFSGMKDFVSTDFYDVMDQVCNECSNIDEHVNVRGPIKRALQYPRNGYLPWIPYFPKEQNLFDIVRNEATNTQFRLGMKDGKVYGLLSKGKALNEIVYDHVKRELTDLSPNSGVCYITVVNSNIVASVEGGIDAVTTFLKQFDEDFIVETGNIKSTYSEDWSVFSECYVLEINCPYIDMFLHKFNETFGTNVNGSKHVTFAVAPRKLW